MTLKVNFVRAVLKHAFAVLLLAAAAAVFGRWQNGHWPQSEFYLSFMLALILVPIGGLVVGMRVVEGPQAWLRLLGHRGSLRSWSGGVLLPFLARG